LAPPDVYSRPGSILVPIDGSHASLQAVALACELARKSKTKVYALHVIEVKRTLPLDAEIEADEARADTLLTRAEQIGREAGHPVEGEVLHAREAGPTIVDDAIERGVELIILGTEYPQHFGEFELGSVVKYVLRSAPCQVWVCRQAPQE
jgi:nucleotide-binding universal stress UspA family protein